MLLLTEFSSKLRSLQETEHQGPRSIHHNHAMRSLAYDVGRDQFESDSRPLAEQKCGIRDVGCIPTLLMRHTCFGSPGMDLVRPASYSRSSCVQRIQSIGNNGLTTKHCIVEMEGARSIDGIRPHNNGS